MRNLIPICVAVGLVAAVTITIAGEAKAKTEFAINVNGQTYIKLVANGPRGKIKGSGTMKIGKAATYPMTVDSGIYTTGTTGSGGGGGSGGNQGGGGGGSTVAGTVTLKGFIKKQGVRLPYVLVGDTLTGDSTLSVTNVVAGVATVIDTDFTGTVTLKF